MASIYDEELTRKTPEDVTLNGVSFRGLDPAIMSVRLIEDAPEMDVQYGQRAGVDGRFVLAARRVRKSLALEFNLRGRFDLAARNQVLDKINAWATDPGWLTSTTQTAPRVNPQPGAPDDPKEIFVRASGPVAAGDAWATTQTYRLTFETLGVPYWRDSVQESGPITIGSTSYDATFAARGSTPAPVSFSLSTDQLSEFAIRSQLNDVAAAVGQPAVFRVDAPGAISYAWQWSPDGVTWYDFTNNSDTFSFTMEERFAGRRYRVTVSDGTTSITSRVASLALGSGLYFLQTLSDAAAPIGATVSFHAKVGSFSVASITWEWTDDPAEAIWFPVSGASGASYEFTMLPRFAGRKYRVTVSDGTTSITSSASLSLVPLVPVSLVVTAAGHKMAFDGMAWSSVSMSFDPETGLVVLTGSSGGGVVPINPWAYLTDDSDGLLLMPASGGTLHIETGAAAMVSSSWRGWYL